MKTLARSLVLFFAIAIAGYAFSFLDFQVKSILLDKKDTLRHSFIYLLVFYCHTTFGGIALLAGPLQFWPRFRNRHLSLHRLLGKVYIGACLLSGSAGLILATFASGGPVAQTGFAFLALTWLYATSRAYRNIRMQRIDAHERWMYRSFALTFAAVTLRLWLPLFLAGGLAFSIAYPLVAWWCWAPNLIVVEAGIRRYLR